MRPEPEGGAAPPTVPAEVAPAQFDPRPRPRAASPQGCGVMAPRAERRRGMTGGARALPPLPRSCGRLDAQICQCRPWRVKQPGCFDVAVALRAVPALRAPLSLSP